MDMKNIEVVCCYSHEDRDILKQLEAHLSPLKREGLLTLWKDMDIDPGTEWDQEIRRHLDMAQVILLIISADFINSDYCWTEEMQRALKRHERREACVIPIIARPVSWHHYEPLSKLQALPEGALPVTKWSSSDEAFYNIVEGIRKVINNMRVDKRGISDGAQIPIHPTIPTKSPKKDIDRATPAVSPAASLFTQPGQMLPHSLTETITPAWSNPSGPAYDLINIHQAPTGNAQTFPYAPQSLPAITRTIPTCPLTPRNSQPLTTNATGLQKQLMVPPPLQTESINTAPHITAVSVHSNLLGQIASFLNKRRLAAWTGFIVLSLTFGCLLPWLTYIHNANTYEVRYSWPLFVTWGPGETYTADTSEIGMTTPSTAIIGAIAVASIGFLFLLSKRRRPFFGIFGGITLNIIAFTYFTFNSYINHILIYSNLYRFYRVNGPLDYFINEFLFVSLFSLWSFVGTRCFLLSANTLGRLLFGTILIVIFLVNIVVIAIYTHYFLTLSWSDPQVPLNVFLWIVFLPLGVDSLRALICGTVVICAAFRNRKSKTGSKS